MNRHTVRPAAAEVLAAVPLAGCSGESDTDNDEVAGVGGGSP